MAGRRSRGGARNFGSGRVCPAPRQSVDGAGCADPGHRRADPPEITYSVEGAIPTTLESGPCQPNLAELAGPGVIQLRALVADPKGAGRALHYVFSACAQTSSQRCPDAGVYVVAEGDAPAPEIDVPWDLGSTLVQEIAAQQALAVQELCAELAGRDAGRSSCLRPEPARPVPLWRVAADQSEPQRAGR